MSDQKPPLAADTLDGVVGRAVDILDGNADRIDWRDPSQPELLRKLCEHLEAWDARGRELDMALDCIDACLADWPMLSHSRISAALSSWKTANPPLESVEKRMNKILGQVRRTLQRSVGHALDMIPRAEAAEETTRLRQQSEAWRKRYDEMVLSRVSVIDEHNPISHVVSVRIIVDDVKSIAGRDDLLRSVIQQLSKQAGW